jgi:hypothetical protein
MLFILKSYLDVTVYQRLSNFSEKDIGQSNRKEKLYLQKQISGSKTRREIPTSNYFLK